MEKISKSDFIKIKNFCSTKGTVKRKGGAIGWEKVLKNIHLIKDYYWKYTNKSNSTIRKQTTGLKNGPKTLTNISPKKIYKWQIRIDVGPMSLGNCKLKQQWDTTTHLLEWPKSTDNNIC